MSDLKQRLLRKHNPTFVESINGKPFQVPVNPDGPEAASRIEALEAALKPFAELKPVSWSLDADMFYIDTDDIRHAASLLEKKPAPPTVEHIIGVALKEPKRGTTWVCEKPKRHHDVFAMMENEGANPFCDSPHDCQQGFHTSTGRFVTRLEAMPIAKAAGQLIRPERGGYQGPELFSEDLW